jgi:hypothetical protein
MPRRNLPRAQRRTSVDERSGVDVPHDDRSELLLALSRGLHQAGRPSDALEETLRDAGFLASQLLAPPPRRIAPERVR